MSGNRSSGPWCTHAGTVRPPKVRCLTGRTVQRAVHRNPQGSAADRYSSAPSAPVVRGNVFDAVSKVTLAISGAVGCGRGLKVVGVVDEP